jgi:hypothetical protein
MGRPISGYPPEAAVSPVPDPRYAATSPAHRTARPSIFHIKRDTTTASGRLLVCSKTNIGRVPPPLAFRIEAAAGPDPDGPARLAWKSEPVDVDLEALFAVGGRGHKPQQPSARDNAKTFLRALLWSGPRQAPEVEAAAEANGISEATLRRAKDGLGVTSEQAGRGWWWCLPGQQAPEVHPAPISRN